MVLTCLPRYDLKFDSSSRRRGMMMMLVKRKVLKRREAKSPLTRLRGQKVASANPVPELLMYEYTWQTRSACEL